MLSDIIKTISSLLSALVDCIVLKVPASRWLFRNNGEFAFLVHPRSDEFIEKDTYGMNDIYRPYPAFKYLFRFLKKERAEKIILRFARWVTPITLSRITVKRPDGTQLRGRLVSTVRTPTLLAKTKNGERVRHLQDMVDLARFSAKRIGLGALLPALSKYGTVLDAAPAGLSTGHAYTGYVICQYLQMVATAHGNTSPRVAVVGAAGSTGTATLRILKRIWPENNQLDLLLIDLPRNKQKLDEIADEIAMRWSVESATDLSSLKEYDYVVVVSAAPKAIIKAEHVHPDMVIIDDSQPRNTSEEALRGTGCQVLDVLARVEGLDCNFDFGFRTTDKRVAFTCLAETVITTALGFEGNLAVGIVDDAVAKKTIELAREAEAEGLVGDLPLFSFGREMRPHEVEELLQSRTYSRGVANQSAAE